MPKIHEFRLAGCIGEHKKVGGILIWQLTSAYFLLDFTDNCRDMDVVDHKLPPTF